MKLVKPAIGVAAAFALSLGQSTAHSATLDLGVFGAFERITAGPEASLWVQNNDHVTDALLLWGAAGAHYSSRLGFDGLGRLRNSGFVSVPTGTPFEIGQFNWRNGTPGDGTTNVNSLELVLSFYVDTQPLNDFRFGIDIDNSIDEGKNGTPDRLKIFSNFGSYRFSNDGTAYDLVFLGFSFDGGETFTNRLVADENDGVKARFYATISARSPLPHDPQAVPVPAAIWLLGSGLVGLIAVARHRLR